MANEDKKDFNAMLHKDAGMPKMQIITDEASGVSAMVQSTRAQGILQGQPDGTLRLEYVSVDADVKEGDIIVTSGIGGIYPKGLPLGTVASVEREPNALYYTVVVNVTSTTENNEEVLVITSLTEEQSASDEEVASANSTPQGGSRNESGDADGSDDTQGSDTDGSTDTEA